MALSFVAWGVVTSRYIWPRLDALDRREALRPILILHGFRFVGMAFLVPGVVSPDLPQAFAVPAAYGDVAAALLALVALAALRTPAGLGLVWLFNLWGTLDLLYAFYQGLLGVGVPPGSLRAAFFIPTLLVPLLLITHALAFRILVRGAGQAGSG